MAASRELLLEVHLLGLIAEAHEDRWGHAGTGRHEFEGAVGAAVAAGLLSDAEADEWRRRFDAFAQGAAPVGPPEARLDRALELLDRLMREAAEAGASIDPYIRFDDAVSALAAVGVLSEDERAWWERRLEQLSGHGDELPDEDEPPARMLRLRGVYAVAPSPANEDVRVTAVECYDDGVLVRWTGRQPAGVTAAVAPWERSFLFDDDVGTAYRVEGGSSGASEASGVLVQSGLIELAPAVPPAARTLRVSAGEYSFELDVSDLDGGPGV